MVKRILADIILFASLFFTPWYVTAGLGIVFMILFKKYWEGILAALFIDALYSMRNTEIYGRFGIFAISAIILFCLLNIVRTKLRLFA